MNLDPDASLGPFPLPPVDEAMRERARRLAGSERWLMIKDPGAPPDQMDKTATQGGYEVDEAGELTGEYKINALYRPSEQVAGMPLDNTMDYKLWLGLNGYNPTRFLVKALYRAELALYAAPGDIHLLVTRDTENLPVLPAFTSSQLLPTGWRHHHHLVSCWHIVDQLGDGPVSLDLNPGTPLALKIMIRDLAGLVTDQDKQGRDSGSIQFDEYVGPPPLHRGN